MVKRQLQRMSRVPWVSGEDTKFAVMFGREHVVWKVVYACAGTARSMSVYGTRTISPIVYGDQQKDCAIGSKENQRSVLKSWTRKAEVEKSKNSM
jgi:hypothetical protein